MDLIPLQRLTLPCGPLAYRQAGSGEPLLLIHGWRGSSNHWQGTLAALADMRTLYAIDLPGHGETPSRGGAITSESLARLAIDFADKAGLARFDLVGHSFGSAVAVAIAAGWPDRVRRLVLTSMGTVRDDLEHYYLTQAHSYLTMMLPWWRPWLALARPWPGHWQPWLDWLGDQPAVSQAIAGTFLRQLPDDPIVVSDGVRGFLNTDPLSALEVWIDAGSPAFLAALAKLAAPVLLLSGDRDLVMPASGVAALGERLPGSRTVLLEGCGHMPMIEWPGPFHQALREFLSEDEGAG